MDELNTAFDKCMAAMTELESELSKLDGALDGLARSVDAMVRNTIICGVVTGVGFLIILIVAVELAV